MSKIIKLKQIDIENIVNNIIKEQGMDGVDNEVQPEELPTDGETDEPEVANPNGKGYDIVVDKNGTHYVIDAKTGEVIAQK